MAHLDLYAERDIPIHRSAAKHATPVANEAATVHVCGLARKVEKDDRARTRSPKEGLPCGRRDASKPRITPAPTIPICDILTNIARGGRRGGVEGAGAERLKTIMEVAKAFEHPHDQESVECNVVVLLGKVIRVKEDTVAVVEATNGSNSGPIASNLGSLASHVRHEAAERSSLGRREAVGSPASSRKALV